MTPEAKTRQLIDQQLAQAGWVVQDFAAMNIGAARGVAVREFPLKTGFADYLLYSDAKAIGVVEAKPEGSTLTGVETQSEKYTVGLPKGLPNYRLPLPFSYESNGDTTRFTSHIDPLPTGDQPLSVTAKKKPTKRAAFASGKVPSPPTSWKHCTRTSRSAVPNSKRCSRSPRHAWALTRSWASSGKPPGRSTKPSSRSRAWRRSRVGSRPRREASTASATHQGEHRRTYSRAAAVILGDQRAALDRLLEEIRKMDTTQAELFATVYFAWNDLLLDKRPADDAAIIAEVHGWHESKLRFTPERMALCLGWMRDHGYVTGTGRRTLPG